MIVSKTSSMEDDREERTTHLRLLYIVRDLSAGNMWVPSMMSLKLRLGGEASSGLGCKIGGVVGLLLNIKKQLDDAEELAIEYDEGEIVM